MPIPSSPPPAAVWGAGHVRPEARLQLLSVWNHGDVGLLERWDVHNQRVLERQAQKAANEKAEDYDGSVAVSSGLGAVEIGVFTFPIGIALLLFGAGWQRLLGLPILVVGGLCVWSLGRDFAEVVRRRRRRN